jgi:5-oxoprolinase (ATP-hydrolysing)
MPVCAASHRVRRRPQPHDQHEVTLPQQRACPEPLSRRQPHSPARAHRLTDPEILEFRFPLVVEHFGIRKGSGGAGAQRGGEGIERRIRFRAPMTVSMLANRRQEPPHGLMGGGPGAVGANWVERADGSVERMGHRGSTTLHDGDAFVIQTPGGGGFGLEK